MTISLSDDAKRQSIASIKRFVAEELEQDIGDPEATYWPSATVRRGR